MNVQLIVALQVQREQFLMENFIGSDDIFALVCAGSFFVESAEGSFTVSAGQGFVFHKNVLYHRRVLQSVTLHLFRYKAQTPPFDENPVIFSDEERLWSTLSLLSQLQTQLRADDFALRRHLFFDLVMQYRLQRNAAHTEDALAEAAMEKIREDLHHGVDLRKIARQSGLSYVQFLRRFKACAGMSPSEYLGMLRIQKAKSLLSDSPLRIKEIAAACGFENEYYFSNYFKARTDLSPSEFRAASRT